MRSKIPYPSWEGWDYISVAREIAKIDAEVHVLNSKAIPNVLYLVRYAALQYTIQNFRMWDLGAGDTVMIPQKDINSTLPHPNHEQSHQYLNAVSPITLPSAPFPLQI